MSERDDGGRAFPVSPGSGLDRGMSMRDYFAAKAMQAILYETIKIDGTGTTHRVARDAYRMADAMLEERAK